MYVCPDCKKPLAHLLCNGCGVQFAEADGVPLLLSKEPRFQSLVQIGEVYDDVYTNRSGVWVDQGRTPEFLRYFAELVASHSAGRVLEVGCGEGFLLKELNCSSKAAIDISVSALKKASARTAASCCAAFGERLPFADESFDVVVSVGVMEHFLDDIEATREIRRVLKPGGHYLTLIHTHMTFSQRIGQKLREYVYPKIRPLKFLRWLRTKVDRPIHQPIQRKYTVASGKDCLTQAGFKVNRTISAASHREAPLVGPHVVIYDASK